MAKKQNNPQWVPASNGVVPMNCVEIGRNGQDGEMMYVGRAKISGDLVPGKIMPSHHVCYVGCNLKEKGEVYYEALVNVGNCHLEWVPAANGTVPIGAIKAGRVLSTGEPLFIGRTTPLEDEWGVHGGKVHPSHGCCYVCYNGKEIACKEYEVLCRKFLFIA